jgi:hypothetical protein
VSCALGCPYQGEVSADEVERVVRLMKGIGVDHCGMADTIGVGTPRRVQAAMERALKHYPLAEVSGHFHDTYGQALANIYACLELGVHTFDTSIAGLGGCPYAKGATGNVATEDVVYMLHGMGIDTGSTWTRWSTPALHQRRAGPPAGDLRTCSASCASNKDALCDAISADYGHRSRHETLLAEIVPGAGRHRPCARQLRAGCARSAAHVDLRNFLGRCNRVIPQPLGVVGRDRAVELPAST